MKRSFLTTEKLEQYVKIKINFKVTHSQILTKLLPCRL